MRDFYEPSLLRRQLLWGLVGGLLAMTAVPLAVIWLNSLSVMPGAPLLVRATVLEATGWPWQELLTVELALGFGFGVTVGLAVPPMEGSGRAVAVRTALHLLVSSGLFTGLCWVCGLLQGSWQAWLTLLGIYWFAYAVVWLLRYLHWRAELGQIREQLGLSGPEQPGRSRALGPVRIYLAMAAVVELAVPPVLRLLEQSSDIPVLTGLLYPYVLLPFFCLVTGWSVGRRRGAALFYPVVCGLMTVPHVLLLYNESALFQVWTAAAFALGGNLAGALVRRGKERAREKT